MSPKGKFRMWHTGLLAFVFMVFSSWQSAASEYIWFWENLNTLGQIGLALTALYYGNRLICHTRTHELNGAQKYERENCFILAIAIVLCGVFI